MKLYRVEHRGISRFVGDRAAAVEAIKRQNLCLGIDGLLDLVSDHVLPADNRFVVAKSAQEAVSYALMLAELSVTVPETHKAEWTLETLVCEREHVAVAPESDVDDE